ncbi:hypothetical protein GCM10010255_28880 [Streptomyces coeruleofuscus]|uniref:Uncharacterized protein n=1 Tax=Streptomyces coeruleofuscus TaxID=66879 RepID=A0ABN3I6A3_9ACTN
MRSGVLAVRSDQEKRERQEKREKRERKKRERQEKRALKKRARKRRDRKKTIVRSILWAFTVVGLALIVGMHVNHTVEERWYASLLGSIGEAMFIAGALGLTVDGLLKAQLVREIAAKALRNSWGVNAPQDYIEKLSESLGKYKGVTLVTELRVNLEWHDDRHTIIKTTYETRSVKQNISDYEWKPSLPWLPPSIEGGPTSALQGLEFTIRNPPQGLRAPVEFHKRWRAGDLADFIREIDGGVGLGDDFKERHWIPHIVPSGTCEARCEAVGYRNVDDIIPLWSNAPALSWILEIEGSALGDLEIRAAIGTEDLQLTDSIPMRGEHGFTHAGATMRVTWNRKQAGAPEEADSGQATHAETASPQGRPVPDTITRRTNAARGADTPRT